MFSFMFAIKDLSHLPIESISLDHFVQDPRADKECMSYILNSQILIIASKHNNTCVCIYIYIHTHM